MGIASRFFHNFYKEGYRKNSKNWDTLNYYRDCLTNVIQSTLVISTSVISNNRLRISKKKSGPCYNTAI